MFRNKAFLPFLLCLCLFASVAFAQSESLISEESIKAETVNYSKTETIEPGTFEITRQAGGTEFYPYTYHLRCEVSGAKFDEYKIGRKDEVKAGDVLAVFTLNIDEVELEKRRTTLVNAEKSYELQKLQKQEDIQKMLDSISKTNDLYERDLLTLRIQRAQIAYEQFCYEQERTIAAHQDSISEMEEEMAKNVLLSPFDGVVTEFQFLWEGERLSTSQTLITLSRTDGMLLRINNPNGYFRYGMNVTIEYGPAKKRVSIGGRVVGEDSMLTEERKDGFAYIQMEPFKDNGTKFINPTVKTSSIRVENVLTVPRRAITLESGKHYVNKLTDGVVQKRFVNHIMQNNNTVWVLEGLSAGETIIID